MEDNSLKQKTVTGVIWKFFERVGTELVTFIVSLVLARILSPSDYGVIAIVSVLISLLNVFVTSGYGTSLIQKKNADDNDFNTIFTFSGILSIFLYLILFFSAPYIAKFYEKPILTVLIRVMGLRLPISAYNAIQYAYVAKRMEFKKFFYATLSGTIVSAIIGISMAVLGFGVWALACQYISLTLVNTIVLKLIVPWKYKPYYSHKLAVPLIKYGSNVLLATLMDTLYLEVRSLIIGKKYDTAALAYYNRGEQFPKLIALNMATTIDGTLMPAFCKIQDNIDTLRNAFRRSIQVSTTVVAPLMIGMAVVAKPMIIAVLTEKWVEAVPYIQIYCVSYMFNPLQSASNQIIKAVGKSRLFLYLDIFKKVIFLISLLFAINLGPIHIALTAVIVMVVSVVVNMIIMRKLLNYSFKQQIIDVLPQIILSVVMGIAIMPMKYVISQSIILLMVQVIAGAIIYILLYYIFRRDIFNYIIGLVKKK